MTKHNIGAMTRRILRHFDAATDEQREQGTSWYRDARTFVARLAVTSPYSFRQVADVTAALSPQVNWEKNMEGTILALDRHASGDWKGEQLEGYGGYSANAQKAYRILEGEDALRGPKVEAFGAAIRGDLSHVTVDIWATRAARAERDNIARVFADDEQPSVTEHRAIAEAYRRAAGLRGTEPAVVQATVWVVIRESGRWQRPQHFTAQERARFWKRQMRARAALGLGIPYKWGGHSGEKLAAYVAA